MSTNIDTLLQLDLEAAIEPSVILAEVRRSLEHDFGYAFDDVDITRPWGGYFRIVPDQAESFLQDFFPGLTLDAARLGNPDGELSPKIMVWMPGKRLSWQYHERRAERWHFLTDGLYYRSHEDALPLAITAAAGDIVQFVQGERHRGAAPADRYAVIAEIWQHTDRQNLSDEADIYRLEDDFRRPQHPTQVWILRSAAPAPGSTR